MTPKCMSVSQPSLLIWKATGFSSLVLLSAWHCIIMGCVAYGLGGSGYLVSGIILDAQTGEPVAEADATLVIEPPGLLEKAVAFTSDHNGSFDVFWVAGFYDFEVLVPLGIVVPRSPPPAIPERAVLTVTIDGAEHRITIPITEDMTSVSSPSKLAIDLGTILVPPRDSSEPG